MSYADYLDYWIDNYCNFNLKYSTIVTYLNIIKLYLKPRLGMYKLSQLDSQMLQEFINDLYVEKNLSKWYLKGILKTIKGSLKYACYTVNFINDNPAERVHIPRYEVVCGDSAHIFTQEEIDRILKRFKNNYTFTCAFLTSCYTGMRTGEVFDLTWEDIDLEKGIINIQHSVYDKPKDILGRWYLGTTKTENSKRKVNICNTLKQALSNYKIYQEQLKELYADDYKYYHLEDAVNEYGKVAEEFQAITNLGEDKTLYDEKNNIGINKEVLEFENKDEYLKQLGVSDIAGLKEYSTVELGNNFQLGTKYSDSMGLFYMDENNEKKPYYMGCYGIGLGRIIACLIENNVIKENDKIKGFALPYDIASYKVQIIYNENNKEEGEKLYNYLLQNNINAIIDDRENLNIGNRINDVYVLGTPKMIILGTKFDGTNYEVEDTKTNKKEIVNIDNIINILK